MTQEYEYARIQYGTAELIEGESDLPPGVIYMQCGESNGETITSDHEERIQSLESQTQQLKISNEVINNRIDAISSIPSGIITMWSGSINNIPDGWTLCNGSNGTPDLRDRFIVGAGNSYNVGNTGGSNDVTLTVAQMPSHNHTFVMGHYSGIISTTAPGIDRYSSQANNVNYWSTSNTGSGQSHENRPPYYALAYIMKL